VQVAELSSALSTEPENLCRALRKSFLFNLRIQERTDSATGGYPRLMRSSIQQRK